MAAHIREAFVWLGVSAADALPPPRTCREVCLVIVCWKRLGVAFVVCVWYPVSVMETSQTEQPLSASQVAQYIIAVFHEKEKEVDDGMPESISNLKLQKLLCFCQVYSLVLLGRPMFRENIYAWRYGPVVKEVYEEYRKHRNNPLPPVAKPNLAADVQEIIADVLKIFGGYSAVRLMNITHSHKPWKDMERRVQKGERDVVIKHKALADYYTPMLTR